MAGQHEDAGDVTVSLNGVNLAIKFTTTGSWLLTETHLQIATSVSGIPQKNGNPIPGQFAYKQSHNPPVSEYTYTVPNSWSAGTTLYIAAHAVVTSGGTCTLWVYSDGTESYVAVGGPGTAASAGAGIVPALGPRAGTATFAWEPTNNVDPSYWDSHLDHSFVHADWIWESFRSVNEVCGDVVDFTKMFTVPGTPIGGTLWVTADNGYEAYVNGTPVASDGLSGDWRNSNLTEAFVTTAMSAWSTVESADLTGTLVMGPNTFLFQTANEYFFPDDSGNSVPGTKDLNPGGLIYEACIQYLCEERDETAWGQGPNFPGKNWGTYFTCTLP
jgi:hypothetical protein